METYTNPESEVQECLPEFEEPVYGIVCGCARLNVRKESDKTSTVICEITAGDQLMIVDESDEAFYKVRTSAGVEGYCMKQFIEKI